MSSNPPVPHGWFLVARSHEIAPGQMIERRYFGEDLVIWRSLSGIPSVFKAHCPHLGAHFGDGGFVDREHLVCPYHHFRFDSQGKCKTQLKCSANRTMSAARYDLQEFAGLLFAYHGPDEFREPLRPNDFSRDESIAAKYFSFETQICPQDINENGVDRVHFGPVHDFRSVQVTPEAAEGPLFRSRIEFDVHRRFMGKTVQFGVRFSYVLRGLGITEVDVCVDTLGVKVRYYICASPIDREKTLVHNLVYLVSCQPMNRLSKYSRFAAHLLGRFIMRKVTKLIRKEIMEDYVVLHRRQHIPDPALSSADALVATYRLWAKQFYSV